MSASRENTAGTVHDRALLLHGPKRNEVLSLQEVQQYGIDSFSDPHYIRLYGMSPTQWYARGIRLLGRTTVECTRDVLADRIARDIASVGESLSAAAPCLAVDPFAGSCNTLYWILRRLPRARGIAFEADPLVYDLTKQNISTLDRPIDLQRGDYDSLLGANDLPDGASIIVFVAPPWGTALDESKGLDLRRTEPPITNIIAQLSRRYSAHRLLIAVQVYDKVNPESLTEVSAMLDWSKLNVYDLNVPGRNHGLLLGTKGWRPAA